MPAPLLAHIDCASGAAHTLAVHTAIVRAFDASQSPRSSPPIPELTGRKARLALDPLADRSALLNLSLQGPEGLLKTLQPHERAA